MQKNTSSNIAKKAIFEYYLTELLENITFGASFFGLLNTII